MTGNENGKSSDWLAERFEQNRPHLRGVAYRMLGSLAEADDAVQEAWLRLSRAKTSSIENLRGWLTTVVARVSLDMLRSRKSRREDSLEERSEARLPQPAADPARGTDPEEEAVLASSVGLALLVVLDTLPAAERLAFVLHDLFATPFEEIAVILGRNSAAARQLASRARRRVHGAASSADASRVRQRKIVDAFLAASRAGDFDALLALLDPDVVLRTDGAARPPGSPPELPLEIHGAEALARRSIAGGARAAETALVNGAVAVVIAPMGRLLMVLRMTIAESRILAIDAVADPMRLRELDLAVLGDF